MSPDDRNLLQRFAKNHDQDAFGALVRRYIGLVYHSALRRVCDTHAAEDITQQVFTLLARKAAPLGAHENLIGWLHTTTRLEAHQFLRRERRRKAREKEVSMHDDRHKPDSIRDWEKLRPVIDNALDRLDVADREAVLMRFFTNQSFAVIGDQLGVTENAARMRVDRALDKLNGILSARDITSVSLAVALASEAVAASAPPTMAALVTAQAIGCTALDAGTAAFFTMTTSKTLVATTAGLIAFGFGLAWYEASSARRARAELESITHSLMESRAQAAAVLTAASARIETLGKELESRRLAQTAPTNPAPVTSSRPKRLWSNAEYAGLRLEEFRSSLPSRFGPLYRALHLSRDQIVAFESIQVECQQGLIDIWAASESEGIDPTRDGPTGTAVARMTSNPLDLKEAKLKALLGEDDLKQYTEYDSPKTGQAVTFVATLAGDLYSSDTPLTSAQGDQLKQAIMAHTEIVREPMASDGGKQMYRLNPRTDWTAVNAAASVFLSDAQRASLQNRAHIEQIDLQIKSTTVSASK